MNKLLIGAALGLGMALAATSVSAATTKTNCKQHDAKTSVCTTYEQGKEPVKVITKQVRDDLQHMRVYVGLELVRVFWRRWYEESFTDTDIPITFPQ